MAAYYGHPLPIETLRQAAGTTRIGSDLKGLSEAAEKVGFRTIPARLDLKTLREEAPLPCILHWEEAHFVVLYRIGRRKVRISDPAQGRARLSIEEFMLYWCGTKDPHKAEGVLLLLEPTPALYEHEKAQKEGQQGFAFLFPYIARYKGALFQLGAGLIASGALQALVPFITQSIVDIGVRNGDLRFVHFMLLGQMMIFLGRSGTELIRGRILLHLSTRINTSLIADLFIKLMRLPISFFDARVTGDIMQRIEDHRRIEQFLTHSTLSVLFSTLNLLIFGAILAWYDERLFFIFLLGIGLYFGWVLLFMKERKRLDHQRFSYLSQEQSKLLEMIQGMPEIKLNNAEKQERWDWEALQARLYRVDQRGLTLEQKQRVGSGFINELKNILIITFSAQAVIQNHMTLGMMLSVSYILGQLNGPVERLVGFIHTAQDARIALERMAEVHGHEEEDPPRTVHYEELPSECSIVMDNVSFRYPGSSEEVLRGIDLELEAGRTTALVGPSGSGKTTLLKLLLRFYQVEEGRILLGNSPLELYEPSAWRRNTGVVMQEGKLFNDSIERNITLGTEKLDREKLYHTLEQAQLREFVEKTPRGIQTRIGEEGLELSSGQKQRILIARALYKDPPFLFFDEATSALDAANERAVMDRLRTFMKGRTSLVIAHRLSTVKSADRIAVLENGRIVEEGDHQSLSQRKGPYYELVQEQLELERQGTTNA